MDIGHHEHARSYCVYMCMACSIEQWSFLCSLLLNQIHNYAICVSLMSPVLTVTLKEEQVLSHSGGGARVHVFLPLS